MSKLLSIISAEHDIGSFPKNVEVIFANNMKSKNRAIKNARGKFITFLNSTDSLAPNFFEIFIDSAEKYSADIVRGRKFYLIDENQKLKLATKEHYESQNQIELLPPDRESRISLLTQRKLSQDLSGAIFNRKFLVENRIEFVINSDLLFSIQTLLKAKIYICIDLPSYIHRDSNEDFSKFLIELINQIPVVKKFLKDPILIEYFMSQSFEKFRGDQIENLDSILRPIFKDDTEFIERLIRFALRPIVQVSIQNKKFFAMK